MGWILINGKKMHTSCIKENVYLWGASPYIKNGEVYKIK